MKGSSGKRFIFHKRLFIYLFLCFLLLYPIMTLIHEGGHYMAMSALGYKHASIHYNYTDTGSNEIREEHRAIHRRNKEAIEKHIPFPEESRYILLGKQIDSMWNIYKTKKFDSKEAFNYASGPVDNMLIGTLGIVLLFIFRSGFQQAERLIVKQWAIALAALSWIGFVFQLFGVIIQRFIRGDIDMRTDGYKVSVHFGLYPWTFDIAAGLLGALAVWVTFKFIPATLRFTLLLAMISGTVAGKLLWTYLGPILLP